MKIDEILKLVNAGYTKDEISAFEAKEPTPDPAPEPSPEPKPEPKPEPNTFDYDKFATAIVKAQQLANGKTNFGGSNEKPDISKFF
jgi:hypothetical protein